MDYGFIYIWYDRKHKRYYIGCHWGHIDDGYVCSSPWMKQAYSKRPHDFRRRILSIVTTSRQDMFDEEARWQSMIKDEELRVRYYNIKRHGDRHWSIDPYKHLSVRQKISKANRGNPKLSFPRPKSEEHRQKISGTLKGRPLGYERNEETRQKISENSKRLQAEGKIGMSGKQHSEETKTRMSINNAMHDPLKRAKIGDANRGKIALVLGNNKKFARPGTELYRQLVSNGYKQHVRKY